MDDPLAALVSQNEMPFGQRCLEVGKLRCQRPGRAFDVVVRFGADFRNDVRENFVLIGALRPYHFADAAGPVDDISAWAIELTLLASDSIFLTGLRSIRTTSLGQGA